VPRGKEGKLMIYFYLSVPIISTVLILLVAYFTFREDPIVRERKRRKP
jgi:hypothetical protein